MSPQWGGTESPRRRDTKGPRDAYAPGPVFATSLDLVKHGRLQPRPLLPKKQTDCANSGKSIFHHANDAIEQNFAARPATKRGVGRRGEK